MGYAFGDHLGSCSLYAELAIGTSVGKREASFHVRSAMALRGEGRFRERRVPRATRAPSLGLACDLSTARAHLLHR